MLCCIFLLLLCVSEFPSRIDGNDGIDGHDGRNACIPWDLFGRQLFVMLGWIIDESSSDSRDASFITAKSCCASFDGRFGIVLGAWMLV